MKYDRLILFFGLIFLLSGCVNTSLSADSDPNVDMSSLKSFFVIRQPKDDRGIDRFIALELQELGFNAEYGDERPSPDSVDALITYQDRWVWDMTIYMLELKVQVREPATEYIVASGEIYRSSLARKPPEEMVKVVVGEIFGSE